MKEENGFLEKPTEEERTARGKAPRRKKLKNPKTKYVLLAVAIGLGSFCAGFFTYRLSLDAEMRTLIKVKNKIQKEYYEEITDEAFYDAVFGSVNAAVAVEGCKTDEEFYEAVYAGINGGLLDDYSLYMTEEEYEAVRLQATGQQKGIGAYFLSNTDDLLVYRIAGNSSAEEAGLQKEDRITAVGKDENSLQTCNTRKQFTEYLSRVPDEQDFYLQWLSSSGESEGGYVRKTEYVENYVYYKTNTESYGFDGEEGYDAKATGTPLSALNKDTAYIQIVQFNGNAAKAFDKAMVLFKSQNKKDLVIDLRGNGGGYVNIMQEIAKYFCKDASERRPIAAIADYGEKKHNFCATDNVYEEFFFEDSRVTVLADNLTASASECLIGCMYAYGVIGYEDICLVEDAEGIAKTFGKGIMQTTYNIVGGGGLKLTTAKIFWPTDTPISIHGVGVTKADGTKTVSYALSYTAQTDEAIRTLYE